MIKKRCPAVPHSPLYIKIGAGAKTKQQAASRSSFCRFCSPRSHCRGSRCALISYKNKNLCSARFRSQELQNILWYSLLDDDWWSPLCVHSRFHPVNMWRCRRPMRLSWQISSFLADSPHPLSILPMPCPMPKAMPTSSQCQCYRP